LRRIVAVIGAMQHPALKAVCSFATSQCKGS
jgi:hypothetical protein